MDTLFKIIIGVLIAVIAGLILLYFKRSRLRVVASPNRRWLFDTINSPDINIKITNLGYEKTEVDDIHLILKKGPEIKTVKENLGYKTLIPIEAKTTKTTWINCSEIIRLLDFNYYSIARVKVLTTNGKTYSSNWISIQEIYDCWFEGSLKDNRIV